ncbi:MAG: M48 family metallopeptidase [Acidobacteriota bacterium]
MNRKVASITLIISIMVFQLACATLIRREGETKTAPHFKPGFNLFSPEQDIEIGRESAQKIARQAPFLRDPATVAYVRQLGARLAAKAPGYKFPYRFEVLAVKEINAFALPGGFIYINAGAIAAAKNEGELAGVMAHEISHVALRHGTNQASKAYIAQVGLDILSGVAGGDNTDIGKIMGAIGGAGANVVFLKMSRTAETESDLEGARMMAEAGYDPRDMANFFKTLEAGEGQKPPEFLSDHPDPGNRIEAIKEVLPALSVSAKPTRETEEFNRIKARLARLGGSKTMTRLSPAGNRVSSRPDPPSENFTEYEAGDRSFLIRRPDNWDALEADSSNVILAPRGAYGRMKDSIVVTHGIFIGAIYVNADTLEEATRMFVEQQLKANRDFRATSLSQPVTFGDREGFATILSGLSTITGVTEIDIIYTAVTGDGRLFYLITISPEDEFAAYKPVFERIIASISLS